MSFNRIAPLALAIAASLAIAPAWAQGPQPQPESSADANAAAKWGPPLLAAAESGKPELVKLLLDAGADAVSPAQ